MAENSTRNRTSSGSKARAGLIVLLTAIVTLFLVGALLVLVPGWIESLIRSFIAPAGNRSRFTPTPSPTPVTAVETVRAMGQLATVQYSIQAVLEETRERGDFWDWLTRERMLLVAYGQVIAGVNLTEVQDEDIRVEGERVTVRLPQAIIISQRVDMDRTYVYDYERGIVGSLIPPDPNWVIEVESKAESAIVERALADGILDAAAANAQVQLTALMYSLGFRQVEFIGR
ncbi:MAG: DUF4230 domain-containing protein [Anaerolineae bacterium]|nr:MAG: DUF4230 domain-containing protein [Anaerolineae bacterium]